MSDHHKLNAIFVKNRAEEIGSDVWSEFVVPPFYNQLISDVQDARKSVVILGGRGCGKTMLLRYWSHESAFSQERLSIPSRTIESIGVYWKTDTQFAHILFGRGLRDADWVIAFTHSIAIKIGIEILKSLESIAKSAFSATSECVNRELLDLSFSKISEFGDNDLCGSYSLVREKLESKSRCFSRWANNLNKKDLPTFYSCKEFLSELIGEIHEQCPFLRNSVFKVYIDEYENLRPYQQRIINTLIKHSEAPLMFNVAVKRNAMNDLGTLSEEYIREDHDFRKIDIEDYARRTFNEFASEIMLNKICLQNHGHYGDIVSTDQLRDPEKLDSRNDSEYRKKIHEVVRSILPSLDQKQMALECFSDTTTRELLTNEIENALQESNSKIPATSFLNEQFPQESVVCSVLLYRKKPGADEILHEFNLLKAGQKNKFITGTDWTNNNFIGAYLRLFQHRIHKCPFYAGFEAYCAMSRGNLRHFLELCHNAVKRSSIQQNCIVVATSDQAHAAYLASEACVREIKSCGQLGNKLHAMVLTLGELFSLSQQRKTQSEPEVSHFSFSSGDSLDIPDQTILDEAIKWSILFEERETKVKNSIDPHPVQWVLNPIYAPFFRISYRKIRKLELSLGDLRIVLNGTYEDRKDLLKRYQTRWEGDESLQPYLPGME